MSSKIPSNVPYGAHLPDTQSYEETSASVITVSKLSKKTPESPATKKQKIEGKKTNENF